jgi:transcription elongation factor S-II
MRKITDPDSFREDIVSHLNKIINSKELSVELEKCILEYATKESMHRKIVVKWDNPAYIQLYTDRLRSIYLNLSNEKLLNELTKKEITPESLANMTHQEMNPEQWKELIDKKSKRDANKYNNTAQASTDMFTCRKCKSKRCTYYELQTRSADEPATIFITCLDCGKNWRS